MIKVTHINGEEFVINADLIQYIEAKPDTIITLVGKERVIVRENVDEVIRRVVEYGRRLRSFPPERI